MAMESTNLTRETPLGATPLPDGALFRTWAPGARAVHVAIGKDGAQDLSSFSATASTRLIPMGDGTWVAGNGGRIDASGPAGSVYPATARVRIPANGALVLVRG